ncbi:MAG: hypothetical protein NT031_05655 [Planctomycetota bacterium]|nr:hypothetical protein [Planctomycetota bacterium]
MPNGSNSTPSTAIADPGTPEFNAGVAIWSASMSFKSSFTGLSRLSLENRMAKASPSCARAIRMVRSLPGRSTAFAQAENSRSMVWLAPTLSPSARSIWSRGPVPITSLARVKTMPRA